MNTEILLEDTAFYHPYMNNPSYGIPVKITLNNEKMISVYKLDNQQKPAQILAQISLTDDWIFDGGDAAFTLKSSTETHRLDFNPRTQLPSLSMLFSIFSPKYKAGMELYVKWKEAIVDMGVRVQKHRTLLPIVVGVVLAIVVLAGLFGGIYLFAK